MARNRSKSQSAAIRFGPALKALLLCLLIGGAGVGYVWQKDQINHLGKLKMGHEQQLLRLAGENEKLRKQLQEMQSVRYLDRRIRELKLGLVQPQPGDVWRLPEPLSEVPAPARQPQYAVQERGIPSATPSAAKPE